MKRLLNTLYISSENSYLALDGENIVILEGNAELARVPLHNLEGVVSLGYRGTSPALMGACAERGISLCYLSPQGRFLARVTGRTKGNVLLRQKQYAVAASEERLEIARNCIFGKLYNARWVLERFTRDHELQVDTEKLKKVSALLREASLKAQDCIDESSLRGIEGEAANCYFSVFDELILQQKKDFFFRKRSRRPPMDPVNALLSFIYALLSNSMSASLEAVGLDPYIGMMHADRPGRASLALDMMEELRAVMADRFVLRLINKRIVDRKDFIHKENGAVLLKDEGRKRVLVEWQKHKKESLKHPYLEESMEWGMVPYAQALLLSRYLRGDLESYPPFLWK